MGIFPFPIVKHEKCDCAMLPFLLQKNLKTDSRFQRFRRFSFRQRMKQAFFENWQNLEILVSLFKVNLTPENWV